MTPTRITGFEYGLAAPSSSGGGLFDVLSGTYAISSSIKRTGSYSLRIYNGWGYAGWSVNQAVSVGSFYLYVAAWDGTGNDYCLFVGSGTNCATLEINGTTHKMRAGIADSSYGSASSTTLSLNTWYRIDYRATSGASPTMEYKIDGVAEPTASHGSTLTNWVNIRFFTTTASGDSYFDDVIFSATSGDYPLSTGHAVVGLRPSDDVDTEAPGTNSLENAAGTDITYASNKGYQYLDENPWTSGAALDRIQGILNTGGGSDHVDIAFADTAESTILGAMALLQYASASTSANLGACVIVDEDATITTLWGNPTTRADYSETSAFYKSAILPTPAGGWDTAAVNALIGKLGYYTDGNPDIYWLAMMLEVAYVPSTGTTYNEAPASSFSSGPVCTPSTFVAMSPSLAAFTSTPALARAVAGDMVGSVAMASTPALNRAAIADFYNTLTWPSTPAVSAIGGMSLFNTLTFASTPAATMAYFLGIFPALTLASSPALSTSALATFYNSLTLASTPAAVMAAIGNFFKSLTLASSPALSVVGGSEFYNTLTVASGPALSTATFKAAAGSVSLASAPTFATTNWMSLLAAITLVSTPALARTGNLDILVSRIMSSSPAFTTTGGMDLYNAITLASNPALAAAVFKAAFPSVSLASIPALSIAAKADLLAQILAASSPGFLAACGFDFIEAIILASGGTFSLVSELTSGPIISAGYERAMSMTAKQAEEILVREMASTAKRLSEQMEKRPAPKATRRDS